MSQDREAYYAKARTWAEDEQASLRSRLRLMWVIAGAATLVAVLEAFALLMLAPLKSVSAVPILVDRQTGFVQVLKPNGRQDITADQALTRSLLAQYVTARERFDIASAAADYHRVALWSGGQARAEYIDSSAPSNPKSPLKVYPRSTVVETRIESISAIGPQVALVRFRTHRQDQDGRAAPDEAWAAVVAYRFVDTPMSTEDRFVNPLGFQVMRYSRDPEVVLQDTDNATSAASAASAAPPATGATSAPTSGAAGDRR